MSETTYRRNGGDKRGNTTNRKARKWWLLSPEAGHDYGMGWVPFGGNGWQVYCIHGCGRLLDFDTVEADRIEPGGPYARCNVQPSCGACNKARSDNPLWIPPWQRRLLSKKA